MDSDKEVDMSDALKMTDRNKERDVQNARDEDVTYELLLDDVHMETLMEEDDHEIETKTGS